VGIWLTNPLGAVLVLTLSGCVCASGFGNQSAVVSHPRPATGLKGRLENWGPTVLPATPDDFVKAWGPPDEVLRVLDGKTRWRYDVGLRWNGVWGFLIVVPYGLFFPVGQNSITLQLEDGVVAEARTLNGGTETWYWYTGVPYQCMEAYTGFVQHDVDTVGDAFRVK